MDLCGHKSIKEYTKYVPEPIEYYVENGFDYSKVGGIFQSKVALAYNYMLARYKLRYQPIVNGSKFNYLFVKPNNRNNIRAIAFIGNWPAEFNEHFEIDYEEMFRKAFMPVIESMFIIKGWIKEKEKIEIESSGLDDFFVWFYRGQVNESMIQVYNIDAIEWLKTLDNDSVDLIVSDPPYRVTQHGHSGLGGIFKTKVGEDKKLNGKLFEHNEVDVNDYAGELYRVLKPDSHCYIMTNDRNLQNFLNVFIDVGFHFTKLIIWDKQNKIANPYYMQQVEYILFMSKGHTKQINNCGTSNLLSISNMANKNNDHPTEKPVELMEILIKNSSKEGDLVMDPFVGVGTTALACQNLNRNFIGCEIDKKYYDTAMERLNSGLNNFFV